MFAAGARQAFLTSDERPAGERAFFRNAADAERVEAMTFDPQRTLLASAHVQGSVKMNGDDKPVLVNSRGEVRGVRNLLVCDASVFPTSCGANPMIAIMAMARYQGLRISAERVRYM